MSRRQPSQTANAIRSRRSRRRRKLGLKVFELPLSECKVLPALRTSKKLPPGTPLTDAEIADGLVDLVYLGMRLAEQR